MGGRTGFWNTKFHQYDVLNRQMNACPMAGILTADVVGELLRFVGHDFMSDNKIDGCFGVDNVENKGLGLAMTYIYNYTDTFCPAYLSKADCSVLLSESAMDITVPGQGQTHGRIPPWRPLGCRLPTRLRSCAQPPARLSLTGGVAQLALASKP